MNAKGIRKGDRSDWARFDAMTEEEVMANALSDPDAQPATEGQLATARRISFAKSTRWKLRLTQEEFSERYLIPLGTLRDWEQHRSEPDATAKAYLRAIRGAPDLIAELVKPKSAA